MERASGIVLHISSLPSSGGIGTLGREAYSFCDFLSRAHQRYWQVLPIGPTGYGDSPYQSFSCFAGNPYFIDPELLVSSGLIERADIPECTAPERYVDYGMLYETRLPMLKKAYRAGASFDACALSTFERDNAFWLDDYALFSALKAYFCMRPMSEWDEDIRMRQPDAAARYRELLDDEIRFYKYVQYLFFSQWSALKKYANDRGIALIGDVPIYAAEDSVDVWAHPDIFQLNRERRPVCVSGVPPDYFSSTGQLWGNPLYDWEYQKAHGYRWWLERMRVSSTLFDAVRIDHFRGLAGYYSIPCGEPTAENGVWVTGPGKDFTDALKREFPSLCVIAEDLGLLTPDVEELKAHTGYPGMKVLEFAFDPDEVSDHLPHAYPTNCVCYTGTHDNDTLCGWLKSLDSRTRAFVREYLGQSEDENCVQGLMRAGMASVADIFMAQMQDWLCLDSACRMNTPGTRGGNWRFRLHPGELTDALSEQMARMTHIYGRDAK